MADLITTKYISKTFNVPFYEKSSALYKVKIKIAGLIVTDAQQNQRLDDLRSAAAEDFITSYLPEFYSFLRDQSYFESQAEGDIDLAMSIVAEIKDSIFVESRYLPLVPPPNRTVFILRSRYDFDAKRQELIDNEQMPSYESNLAFFNDEQGISGASSETTLVVGTLGQQNNLLNNGLKMFDTQYAGFEGQININVAFGPMQVMATTILNILVTLLSEQLKIQSPSYDFTEADTITLIFGKKDNKLAISGINYLLVEQSIQSEPLKIGYFSIIKNNNMLKDPLLLAILRNYRNLLRSFQDFFDTGSPFSFFDFVNDPSVRDSLAITGEVFENFQIQPKKDMTNELLKVANEFGLIDVKNVDELEKGFKDYFTSEEFQELKSKVADNPEVFKRVFAAQKVKALTTGVEITKVIGNVLEQGPLGLIEKANPRVAYILRQFGIDAIAREAFLCLTFGASASLGRVNKAVQNSLVKAAASVYYPPDLPKRAPIELPEIDFEQFKPFTISGDLWRQIEKAIIDAIQQLVLEVIGQLADLLKENCDLTTPRSSDYGANDLTTFINTNPMDDLLPNVGATSQLDQLSGKNGLTTQQTLDYLSALSSILSSIDICILFLNPTDASDDLLNSILEFNAGYGVAAVSNRLNTYSNILGFFSDLAATVDVTDLCNEIANELYATNQDNVCLDGALDNDNIDALLDLIENGLQVNPPEFNLDCPEGEFVDPTVSKSIPETFNVLAETVQLQFIASGDSVREILLEPVQKNQSFMLDNIRQVPGVDLEGDPINAEVLGKVVEVLNDMSAGFTDFEAKLAANCDVNLARLLGTDQAAAAASMGSVATALSSSLTDPAFKQAIENLANNIGALDDPASVGNPVFTSYRFNQSFINDLRNYIIPEDFMYDPATLSTVTPNFYSTTVETNGGPTEYRDLNLFFIFGDPSDVYEPPVFETLVTSSTTASAGRHFHLDVNPFNRVTGDFAHHDHDDDINGDGVHDTESGAFIEGHIHPGTPNLGPATLERPIVSEDPFDQPVQAQDILGPPEVLPPGTPAPNVVPNSLKIIYPRFDSEAPQLSIDFNIEKFFANQAEDEVLGGTKDATLAEQLQASLNSTMGNTENVFVQKFAAPIIAGLTAPTLDEELAVYYEDYPRVYNQLVDNMFEYVLDNGIFDAATLQSLNFFSLNENCPPSELGDFLDVQGIIDQMIEEYKEAACSGEDVPLSSKIRNSIKYGMYLMLIQIHIAEVLMKNIFVMSAYTIDSLLNKDSVVFAFIRGQILQSLLAYFDNVQVYAENTIRQDLTAYFNLKIQRPQIVQQGGILYTDGSMAIPEGTQFSVTGPSELTFYGFDELLDFLITDRIERSRTAINNALRKSLTRYSNPLSFDEALLRSIPGVTVPYDTKAAVEQALANMTDATSEILQIPQTGIIMTKKIEDIPIDGVERRFFKLWYKKDTEVYLLLNIGVRTAGTIMVQDAAGLAQQQDSILEFTPP